MDQFDQIKTVIDDNLQDLEVTKQLKRQTLNRIFHKENRLFLLLKAHFMKAATLFSSFVIVLSLSVNMFFKNTKAPLGDTIKNNDQAYCPPLLKDKMYASSGVNQLSQDNLAVPDINSPCQSPYEDKEGD